MGSLDVVLAVKMSLYFDEGSDELEYIVRKHVTIYTTHG
jgi:hypothetical protein